jgi:hypothetical protein
MVANYGRYLFPLRTVADTAILIFGVVCVLIYAVCMAGGIRVWSWHRQRLDSIERATGPAGGDSARCP